MRTLRSAGRGLSARAAGVRLKPSVSTRSIISGGTSWLARPACTSWGCVVAMARGRMNMAVSAMNVAMVMNMPLLKKPV